MIFRYARHTNDLQAIGKFYTEIVGLNKLGGFQNHDNYDGLFLGFPDADWHLEFTTSTEKPNNKFDDDDILVFYVNTEIELANIKQTMRQKNIAIELPQNPYWIQNGVMIADPDGFKIVFSLKQRYFNANDELTNLVRSKNIKSWSELIEFIRNLPYGRNLNREDLSLVLKENKGTCSSKHAFLKKIADLNNFDNIKLCLALYRMNHINTPKIGNIIEGSGLAYIPEAHCYLMLNNQRIDVTSPNADIANLAAYLIEEIEIEPEQVNIFKVEYHKNYLKQWRIKENIPLSFDEIWQLREKCIRQLEA